MVKKDFLSIIRKETHFWAFSSHVLFNFWKKRKEKFGLYIMFHIMSFSAFKNTLYYDISNIERCILNDFNSCNNTLLHSMIWTAHTYAHIHPHTHTHNENNKSTLLCSCSTLWGIFFVSITKITKTTQNNAMKSTIIKWMKKYQMFILKSTLWAHK